MMLIGRFLSTIISGKVSTRAQMITVSSVAILLVLIAIFLPEDITFKSPEIAALNIMSGQVPLKCLFLFLCGLCTSVMWGGIFNLATEGLGKYTAKASGADNRIIENVGEHCHNQPVAVDITESSATEYAGDPVLYERHDTAADNHHHE